MCLPQVIKSFQNYRGVATTFYPTLVYKYFDTKKCSKFMLKYIHTHILVPWLGRYVAGETRVRSRTSLCGICGRQMGTGTGFLQVPRLSSVSIISPVLQAHSFSCHRHCEFSSLNSFFKLHMHTYRYV